VSTTLSDLLSAYWAMQLGERAAYHGILNALRPSLSIEIGTGGSLAATAEYSETVHAFDLVLPHHVDPERFPNVTFHIGESHELLPVVLGQFAGEGRNLDFALVDGDHTAPGVRRDVEDILSSPCSGKTVILLHDTLNERVRAGLEEIDFDRFERVTYVELDMVQGRLFKTGSHEDELWCGLGVILTGWSEVAYGQSLSPAYSAAEVYDGFAEALSGGDPVRKPGYGHWLELEQELATARGLVDVMERSLSWRLTAPLRSGRTALRRVRNGS
jgi:hypothetical protein